MEITTTSNRMFSLLVLYDMQTLYFERALEKFLMKMPTKD